MASRTVMASRLLLAVTMAFAAAGCAGHVFYEAQHVVVTGIPGKVAHCQYKGPVAVDGSEHVPDDQKQTLRERAVINGANTVYLSSPATSIEGSSYLCNPPARPDDAR